MTYYNIGNIYKILAEVENKNENCERATSAYEEALKVYTQEQFPSECKKIKENIKIVHKMLSMID